MVNILHPGTGPVQSVLFGKRWPTNLDGSAIDLIPAVHLTVIQSYTSYNWLMVSLSLSLSLFLSFVQRRFSYSAVFPTPLFFLLRFIRWLSTRSHKLCSFGGHDFPSVTTYPSLQFKMLLKGDASVR
jgi:hypothetical protein